METVKPTIILVHGAFADASGWQPVIGLLQDDGYPVLAVQNALESLASDVETTKRAIDAQTGPIVVVGHSYGGAVMTGAAAGNPNVKALVFLSAFAPEAGEPVAAFGSQYPIDLDTALVPDAAGLPVHRPGQVPRRVRRGPAARQTAWMAVAQRPIQGSIFGQSVPEAAWKTIPSWYVVAQQTTPSTRTWNGSTPSA